MKVNQKGFIPILILIAVVMGLGLAYFLGTKNGNLNSIVSVGTPVVIQTSLPAQTSDPTSGWKTYQNNYFLIEYPADWSIDNKTDMYLELVKQGGSFDEVTQKNTSLTISFSPNTLNYAGCSNPYSFTQNLTLDGKTLILGVQKQQNQFVGSVTENLNQCWFNNNKINYAINFYSKDNVSGEIQTILSTFKFTK